MTAIHGAGEPGEQEQEAFFRQLLAGVVEPTAPFGLAHGPVGDAAPDRATLALDAPLARRVRERAGSLGVRAASLIHVAWAQVLARVSGRQEVVFGTALFGPAKAAAAGALVNTLPVRAAVGELGAADSVRQMDAQLLRLRRHAQAPAALVRRCCDPAAPLPLFSALLSYRRVSPALADAMAAAEAPPRDGPPAPAAAERPVEQPVQSPAPCPAQYALMLAVHEQAGEFKLTAHVCAPLQAERLCAYVLTALERLLEALERAPDTALRRLDILPPAEREQLLRQFNATARAYPRERCLHQLFEEQVRRSPDAIALVHGDTTLTYQQLNAHANRLAHHLAGQGVRAGDYVALALGRSAELVIAQLAVLKAGAAYVPLSEVLPLPRQALMLADCGAKLVLAGAASKVPAGFARVEVDDPAIAACPATDLASASATAPATTGQSRATAYVMYTSGSTGHPKGVEVPHRAVTRLVVNNGYADFGARDRVAFASNPAFDASTMEVWAPLLNGGAVVVIEPAVLLDPARLVAALQRHAVTVLWLTVGLFNQYADSLAPLIPRLRYLIVGGDKLDPEVMRRVLRDNPPQHLLNGYGPTETTTFAATYHITAVAAGARSIPIGAPIGNTQIYILDPDRMPVPIGVAGEIYIGGDGVARGYLNQPELSDASFLPNPFIAGPDQRMYKTGDLGRWLPDGNIDYLGRNDRQVKIRGFRIETGEIESVLARHDGVKECAVLARTDDGAPARLVAYVVAAGPAPDPAALRAHLAALLPEFMVPAALVFLAALPLTVNGKLDRAALPAPAAVQQRPALAQPYLAALNDEERLVCALFAEQLAIERAGRLDNFFELGGNSFAALALLVRLQERTGATLSPALVFEQPTAAGLAAALRGAPDGAIAARRVAGAPGGAAGSGRDAIAVVALSGRFPGAGDTDALWRNLRDGLESLTVFSAAQLDPSIPAALRAAPGYVKARAVMDDVDRFDAAFFGISPREAEVMDPQQRIFLELCWDCLERGGYAPDATERPVGVFGGVHVGGYLQHHVRAHPDAVARAGDMALMLANEKDYVATRVAYRLNLTGPAVSVHSACSTSLVAVVQAMTSLRAGQCHMALAGGVTVTCPPRSGYLYQEGAILSPDGHTRAFDADARGTVFGDGGAVVLLKRLADAQADGDPVLAVLRGGAINNDGGGRASFTAPSVDGQAAVVAAALADAGVNAREISYVEAHGTGTPIGDPIEIEALTRAYRRHTEASGYCRIGSVKSNLGHLVTAAGVTGLIKTVLALQHEELPATLHYRAANPKIDFGRTPFTVNASRTPWPRAAVPRRAGVSAFGFGGTNAHVIVEEAPAPPAPQPGDGPHLLLVSARSAAALAGNAARLAAHLAAQPQLNLADVAYTLRAGRSAMAERVCVVANDVGQAVALLGAANAPMRAGGRISERGAGVAFMFPGQAAQYAAMGSALYAAEPVFRRAYDACLEALDGAGADWKRRLLDAEADALAATATTQPALFCLEYALASYWIGLGVRPVALIGHSVGEFVAAALAGVFSVADAARLVARRGQLMQVLPAGAMLAVRMGAAQLEARLPAGLSLAAENSPLMSVVAGPAALVEQLRRALDGEGVSARPLQTSHAFHSAMMEPALAPFEAELRTCRLAPPRLPIYSTVTGQLLSDQQACDPGYWARHLRAPVRFAPALSALLRAVPALLLEVGPRATLGTLARQQATNGAALPGCVASLADRPEQELAQLRLAAGRLWIDGAAIELEKLDQRDRKLRVTLPGYAFERQRHWLEAQPAGAQAAAPFTGQPNAQPAAQPAVPSHQEPAMPTTAVQERIPRLIAELRSMLENTSGIELPADRDAASLLELGFDSLTLTQVAIQLKQAFKVNITFRQLMEEHTSIDALARHLDRQLPVEAPAAAAPEHASAVAAPLASAPASARLPVPVATLALAPISAEPGMPTPTPAPAAHAAYAPQGPDAFTLQLIQQQMQLMAQQLTLLQAAARAPAAQAASTPAPPPAPVAVAPAPPALAAPAEPDEAEATGPGKYDVKKAFGAIARIHTDDGAGLSTRQRARLDAFVRRYVDATRSSKEHVQANRGHLADPRVVNGFRPMLKEIIYQIVIERSQGASLWDLDGNEYVDANNGFGMSLFGWQPPFIVEAVKRQLDAGYEIGPQHPLAGEVARLVCELTGHDRAGLCNTGSEAVMGAMRIARTVTGRNLIVLFAGSYHGIFDEVIVRATKRPRPVPAAPGILPNTTENVIVLDYGTPATLELLRARIDEIAAVLVEPVQSRRPEFQPVAFLRELRDITSKGGAALIFDEVITGFRAAGGGVQQLFGIRADIGCYGKVIGGGFPIGVIAGKREFLDALDGGAWQYGDDSVPTVGVTYFAGTFVRHPLALAAARAALNHIKDEGPALQERLDGHTAQLAGDMNAFCREVGAPIEVRHFSSLWKIFFTEEHVLQDLLFAMMRNRGVHILDHFPCFLTTAHSEQDIAHIKKAFTEAVAELQDSDFLPRRAGAAAPFDASRPPVPEARLGRDPLGNPAWFLADANNPGKYLRLDA